MKKLLNFLEENGRVNGVGGKKRECPLVPPSWVVPISNFSNLTWMELPGWLGNKSVRRSHLPNRLNQLLTAQHGRSPESERNQTRSEVYAADRVASPGTNCFKWPDTARRCARSQLAGLFLTVGSTPLQIPIVPKILRSTLL